MREQSISLSGVGNARELGGYRIGNRRIKSGVLIRTATLCRISPEAAEALQKRYNVQTVIDLRTSMENRLQRDPLVPGAENIHLPPIEMEELLAGVDPVLIERYCDPDLERMTIFNAAYEGGLLGEALYEKFLLTGYGRRAWKAFFKALLALEEGRAVLWHCTDGKDRTGCAAMLVLFALGADRDTVLRDYLLTNKYNEEGLRAVRQKVAPLDWPEEKVDSLLFMSGGVSEAYMTHAIDALTGAYGSVEAYLGQELGVGAAEREALRGKFLS